MLGEKGMHILTCLVVQKIRKVLEWEIAMPIFYHQGTVTLGATSLFSPECSQSVPLASVVSFREAFSSFLYVESICTQEDSRQHHLLSWGYKDWAQPHREGHHSARSRHCEEPSETLLLLSTCRRTLMTFVGRQKGKAGLNGGYLHWKQGHADCSFSWAAWSEVPESRSLILAPSDMRDLDRERQTLAEKLIFIFL